MRKPELPGGGARGRGRAFVGGNVVAVYEYFRRAWWSGERADRFRFDWEQTQPFRQADKFGQALGGYQLARAGGGVLGGACVARRRTAWWGGAYASAFQWQIELWDATQAKYGFSPLDVAANTAGSALALAQTYNPALRHLKPASSYARSADARNRDRYPPGAVGTELRPWVDYAGQTYWLSANPRDVLPAEAARLWPAPVRVPVGRSVTGWIDPTTGGPRRARSELVASVDLDPSGGRVAARRGAA